MSRLSSVLKSGVALPLVRQYVGFWTGKAFVSVAESTELSPEQRRLGLAVISRAEYTEVVESFPIKSQNELKQLLANKYGHQATHWIGRMQSGTRQVRSALYKPSALQAMTGNTFFSVPESWLLSGALRAEEFYKVVGLGRPWYIYKTEQNTHTIVENALVSSDEVARASLGVPEHIECRTIDEQKYRMLLVSGLGKIPISLWPSLRVSRQQSRQLPYRDMAIAAVGVVSLYLLVSTLYLNVTSQYKSAALESQSAELEEKMDLRGKITSDVDKIKAVNSIIAGSEDLVKVWDVIGSIYMRDVRINNLQTDVDQIELSGVTNSATDLASYLRELPLVSAIELTSPVRRGSSGDVFSLLITLDTDAVSHE